MTDLPHDPRWTGPVRDATGGEVWRLPGTEFLISKHPTSGVAVWRAPEGEPRKLVSIGFRGVGWAMDAVARLWLRR